MIRPRITPEHRADLLLFELGITPSPATDSVRDTIARAILRAERDVLEHADEMAAVEARCGRGRAGAWSARRAKLAAALRSLQQDEARLRSDLPF